VNNLLIKAPAGFERVTYKCKNRHANRSDTAPHELTNFVCFSVIVGCEELQMCLVLCRNAECVLFREIVSVNYHFWVIVIFCAISTAECFG